MFGRMMEERPTTSLDDVVDWVLNEFPDAWKSYWGIEESHAPDHLSAEEWEEAQRAFRDAERLARAASILSRRKLPEHLRTLPTRLADGAAQERGKVEEIINYAVERLDDPAPGIDRDGLNRLVSRMRRSIWPAEAVRQRFEGAAQLTTARAFMQSPGEISTRTLALLEYLVRAEGLRTGQYLERVALCYIRDMRPELAVMARSVLECALQDHALEARVRARRGISKDVPDFHATLSDWIHAARTERLLDEFGFSSAENLRLHGNDAIHLAPQNAPDADETMERLVVVLNQLEMNKRQT